MNVGHLILSAFSILLKWSPTNNSASLPYFYFAISFTDFIGLISIKAFGSNSAARWHAGPDPILLPLIITLLGLNFKTYVTNLKIVSESFSIYYDFLTFESSVYIPYPGYSTAIHDIESFLLI